MTRAARNATRSARRPARGLFITVEGIEGSGKTTQVRRLVRRLARCGFRVLATREPGGSPIAERIRGLILRRDHARLTAKAELFLYLAARAQHVDEVILPALASGAIVVCDRFSDATIAYQGDGRGLSRQDIVRANRLATGNLTPDITLLLDLDVRLALPRVERRGRPNRLDAEAARFHRRVRAGYLRQAHLNPLRFRVIRADAPPPSIEADIWAAVLRRLPRASRPRSQEER